MKPYLAGTIAAAALIVAFVVGTQIELENDGPLEQAGEQLDSALEGANDAASDAGGEVGDALRQAGDSVNDAARELTAPVQQ